MTRAGNRCGLNLSPLNNKDSLKQVPGDWCVIRYLIVATALMGFGMFFAYELNFMASVWPF